MSLAITDEFCECGMPSELELLEFWHGNGEHVGIAHYRCVNNHTWKQELTEEVPDE